MSLILDALNRSEQDRQNNSEAPGLHSRHSVADIQPRRLWLAWLVVAVVAAAFAIGAQFWRSSDSAETDDAAIEKLQSVPPDIPVRQSASGISAVKREHASAAGKAVASLYQVEQANSAAEALREAPQLKTVLDLEPHQTVSGENERPSVDVEALASAVEDELARPAIAEHPAPLLEDMAQNFKDQVPTLFFREHDWSSSAADSSVNLNGVSYRGGDQIAPGLSLLDILPNSILLDFRGEKFRLRALNSWVNL